MVLRLAAGSLPAAALLLAVMAFLPVDTVTLAHWIRMGLVAALPISGLAIVLYPFVTRTAPREDRGDVPPRTLATVLFGVVLGLLVTLTSVGAGAIGVTVLAALYPMLPAKRLVGTNCPRCAAHAARRLGHLSLGNVGNRLALSAAMRVDPRHSDGRAAGRDRARTAAPAYPGDHALLRGLGAVQ